MKHRVFFSSTFFLLILSVSACSAPGINRAVPAGTPAPRTNQTNDVVDITAHPWWWQVSYPNQQVTTANEVHIPVGKPVQVQVTSDDVVGNFSAPELQSSINLYPNRTDLLVIEAGQPGIYRATCKACGNPRTTMALVFVADAPEQFDAWLEQQRQIPQEPTDETLRQGEQAFLGSACVYCHTIRGTNASGTLGPDLTHLMSRHTIGAGVAPNIPGYLAGWIINSQNIKPGNKMPPMQLDSDQLIDLLAYLQTLK